MIVAVTGTVGSGKSGVATMLAAGLGWERLDSDELCRQLLSAGQPAWRELKKRWSEEFFDGNGQLDRVRLREAVFAQNRIRRDLEEILHPLVLRLVKEKIEDVRATGSGLLAEVPLLFEVGWQSTFDRIIAVYAPAECSIRRVIQRDRVAREQAEAILRLQLSALEKAALADFVIDNSGTWVATALQVARLTNHFPNTPKTQLANRDRGCLFPGTP